VYVCMRAREGEGERDTHAERETKTGTVNSDRNRGKQREGGRVSVCVRDKASGGGRSEQG